MKLEKLNKKALYCMYLVTSIVCVVIAAVLGSHCLLYQN